MQSHHGTCLTGLARTGLLGLALFLLCGCGSAPYMPPETRGRYMYSDTPWELRDYLVLADLVVVGRVSSEEPPQAFTVVTTRTYEQTPGRHSTILQGHSYRIMVERVLKGSASLTNGEGRDRNLRVFVVEEISNRTEGPGYTGHSHGDGLWYTPKLNPGEQAIFVIHWGSDFSLLCDPVPMEAKPTVRRIIRETRGYLPPKD